MRDRKRFAVALFLAFVSLRASAQVVVRSGVGAAATTARDQFRADIGGGTVAAPNGSFGGLRREINWDDVPDAFASPNNLPANYFNSNSPRGVLLSTPGTGLRVSASAASGTPVRFGEINPTYPATFVAFSPERLFSPLGSNITDISFFVPGTNTPALVYAFGAMLTDVDFGATIELFGAGGESLGALNVAACDHDVAFVGLTFADHQPRIARVRIISGTVALGPNDGPGCGFPLCTPNDVVAVDDIIYSEPAVIRAGAAVPALSTTALVILGSLLALAAVLRMR
ncbi:MAG: hypothetical protein M3Q69_05565 [Acidobacteriota bacterium]|nr:hypothetical protein [Acidobacteriota bacterium]